MKVTNNARRARHNARVFALLGLYEWLVDSSIDYRGICVHLNQLLVEDETTQEKIEVTEADFANCDRELFETLITGVLTKTTEIEATFMPFVDRELNRISLVERAILYIGTYELMMVPQTPWRVAVNEGVELAKKFGSGYAFTNSVLDKVAHQVRPEQCAKL